MVNGILLFVVSTCVVAAYAVPEDFLGDKLTQQIMDEMEWEEERARSLITGIEADGSLGSRCGLLNQCDPGFDCFHNRCFPNRECLKERLAEFDASFDSEAYKRQMFQAIGFNNDDIGRAMVQSHGDQVKFVQSDVIQSMMDYMKENSEPFEPVAEIVDACSGVIPARRLNVDISTVGTEMENYDRTQRRLQPSPTKAPSASPSAKPSVSPSTSSSPSTSASPSSAFGGGRGGVFLGLHFEAGAVFEASVSVLWRRGGTAGETYLRGCIGAELGASIEFSFNMALTFDDANLGYECGSVLLDADAGIGIYAGFALGICFTHGRTCYVDFNVGAGIGAGLGYSVCGVLTLPTPSAIDEFE